VGSTFDLCEEVTTKEVIYGKREI